MSAGNIRSVIAVFCCRVNRSSMVIMYLNPSFYDR